MVCITDRELTETRIDSKKLYGGVIFDLYRDAVALPDGGRSVREYVRHVGAACVVPVTADGKVLMVRQYRYPFGAVLTEVPAGKLDGRDEDPAEAARRELREETGASAASMTYLGPYYPTCAYSDEVIHMYLARGLTYGACAPDEDEFLEPLEIPLEDLIRDVMAGKIPDGKTQTALLKAYYLIKNEERECE